MILITGATGFLGSELTRQLILSGKNSIRCTKRVNSVVPKILQPFVDQIDWVEADLLDIYALNEASENVTEVYNCAAMVSFDASLKNKMIKTNVEGTANVVNLCLEKNIRLLHVSSVTALAKARPGQLITEKDHPEESLNDNPYAVSKLESEMEVWRGIAEGLDAVIVNPSLIIGKNAGTEGSGQIFETVRKGLRFYTRGTCGLVDVEDVAKAMILLMESDISGERYIISAENWPYKKLFDEAAKDFGIKPPAVEAKPWMLELSWRASALASAVTGKRLGVDKISAQAGSHFQKYDNSKIKAATGIEFKPITKSIAEICEALKVG